MKIMAQASDTRRRGGQFYYHAFETPSQRVRVTSWEEHGTEYPLPPSPPAADAEAPTAPGHVVTCGSIRVTAATPGVTRPSHTRLVAGVAFRWAWK